MTIANDTVAGVRLNGTAIAWSTHRGGPLQINIIKDLLSRLHYIDKDKRLTRPDPQIVFAYDVSRLENDQLAK